MKSRLVTDPAKRERATRAMVAFDADNRDEQHPLYVLWTWERMIREDFRAAAIRLVDSGHWKVYTHLMRVPCIQPHRFKALYDGQPLGAQSYE